MLNPDNGAIGKVVSSVQHIEGSVNQLVAQLRGLVFYKNNNLIYTAASTYAARLCGFKDADQFCGHDDFELRCPASESADDFRREDQKVLSLGKEMSCLQIHQFADGNTHIFLLRKAPVCNAQGEVIGVCSMGNEVTNPGVGQAIFNFLALGNPLFADKNLMKLNLEVDANVAFNKLSLRESELMFYFMRGFSNKEIGKFMLLSPRTVECYLETIKSKFNCISKNELLLYCMHNGFSYILPQTLLQRYLNKSLSWNN